MKNARAVKAGDASIDDLGVVALDTYLLQITFEEKIDYENFKKSLASIALVPLREESVANNDRYWSRRHATLVSNGPFVIKEIDRDENTMRIERNNYYYRDTEEDKLDRYVKPYRILVTFIKEEDKPQGQRAYADDLDAIYAAYQAEDDFIYMGDVPLAQRAALKKQAHVTDANSTYSYLFNTKNALFADARVRRALSMAIDRQAIADLLVYADPATGLIANTVFNATEGKTFRKVLAFNIPKTRSFMHLDTVFTQIDYDKFTIHPGIMGPLTVFEITPDGNGGTKIRERDEDLESILTEYVGQPVKLIPCGGGRIAAEREQWNDGSNTLCVRPGTVVVYQRNNVTNDVLYKEGLDLLVVPSAELSRGRGGPRCMSMPFWREDL